MVEVVLKFIAVSNSESKLIEIDLFPDWGKPPEIQAFQSGNMLSIKHMFCNVQGPQNYCKATFRHLCHAEWSA